LTREHLAATHNRLPVSFTHGEGVWLWDQDGKRYLDALAGIAVSTLGHGNPRLVNAIASQARHLIHISNNYLVPQQAELACLLTKLSGLDRAFFVNSGTEANECAIKVARLYGHKREIENPKIVVLDKAFHGRTLGSLSATASEKIREGFGPLLDGFIRVPPQQKAIEQACQDKDVVAVFLEVIQGEGGINVLDDQLIRDVRRICNERDILFMVDEVQTGIGRTGKMFACQHSGVVPDVMSLAKGLGGGVPVGACLMGGRAKDVLTVGSHGSTYGGNPLVCAAALAVLGEIQERALCDNAQQVGEYLVAKLRTELSGVPGVVEVRGKGLLIGIELDRPAVEVMRMALDAGLLVNATSRTVVRLVPPLIITTEETDELLARLIPVLKAFLEKTH
jgi:acetylornithine aminotransferase